MKRIKLSFAFLLLLIVNTVSAQVVIAPTNVYIDDSDGFGTYMVINNSNDPQEVSIDFLFSYLKNHPDGTRTVVTDDSLLANNKSLVNYLRAFPRNFVLEPDQRQIVRIRVTGLPDNFNDGTYWARIKTSSSAQSPPIEVHEDENVGANINFIFDQITGIFYTNGDVTTGIEINNIDFKINDSIIETFTEYKLTGNSPFSGTISVKLFDSNNNLVSENFAVTHIYTDGNFKLDLPKVSDIQSGIYTLRIEFITERSDISSSDIVQMEPVTATTTVTIP